MSQADVSLTDFLNQVAERQPTPGGGSASAFGGALGTALGSMAATFTVGNEKYAQFDAAARGVLDKLSEFRTELMRLFQADIEAYDGYRKAAALPKTTEGEKLARTAALNAARETATVVPEQILSTAHAGLMQLEALTLAVNPNMAGDVAAGAYFLEACARGAAIQVYANCTPPDPTGAKAQRRDAALTLVNDCERLRERVHSGVLKLMKIDE